MGLQRLIGRAVLVKSRGDRYRFRHQEIQDFLYAWDAALRTTMMPTEVLSEVPAEVAKGILRWMQLLYHRELPEMEAQFVASLLDCGPHVGFYTRAAALDLTKQQANPSPALGSVLGSRLGNTSYARYFFHDLSDPVWLKVLAPSGLFAKPPTPVQAEPGLYRLPTWEAGEYLVRVAAVEPERVVTAVKSLKSENSRAYHTLLEATLRMPAAWAAKMVPVVVRGLDTPFRAIDPRRYGELMVKLADSNEWDQAMDAVVSDHRADTATGRQDVHREKRILGDRKRLVAGSTGTGCGRSWQLT